MSDHAAPAAARLVLGSGPRGTPATVPLSDLNTHVFICGATGSGKTVLGKLILQEAAMAGIPAIAVDLKGDISSMAVPVRELAPGEIEPFLEDHAEESRSAQAVRFTAELQSHLEAEGRSARDLQRFRELCGPVVFTPRSGKGVPLGCAPITSVPAGQLARDEPEALAVMAASQAASLVQRLYPALRPERLQTEQAFLEEVLRHAWERGLVLEGAEGLKHLVAMVENPPMARIGAMNMDDYLPPKDRLALARKMNTLLVGASRLWTQGLPISDVDGLLRAAGTGGRTPICIINLAHLDTFADRAFVVSQLACSVYLWMRRHGGTTRPRLLFFIDEIGGGGGRQAFFPSPPFDSPCKAGLNLLVRQGRAFGACLSGCCT